MSAVSLSNSWGNSSKANYKMEKGLANNLAALLKRYRNPLLRALAMVLISNCLLVVNPLLMRQAIYSVYDTSQAAAGWAVALLGQGARSIFVWGLILLTVASISAYFKYRMRIAFVLVSREAERCLRLRLFQRLQAQTMAFFDRHPIGDLMSSLTNDIAAYREMLGPGIMYPLYFLTMVGPALVVLFRISAPLAMVSLLPIFIMPLMILAAQRQVYRTSRSVQDVLGKMSTFVHEHYSGNRIVKSYVSEERSKEQFTHLGVRFYHLSIWLSCLRGIFYPLLTLFTKAVTVCLVLATGFSVYYGLTILTPVDFVAFMWVQSYIFGPVLMLGWVLPLYQRGSAAYDRLFELYQEPIEVDAGPEKSAPVPKEAEIAFHHLTFFYPGVNRAALHDITLTVQPGTFVGITGPVGAGKSTLLRLLNRQYAVDRGMIFIGGKEIHEYSLQALHKAIGMVEQTPFLFSKSVAENVGFGLDAPSIDEIESVTRLADLHKTVVSFPEKYETMVGERGVRLSGGQKQRVALARLFLVDRSILLLDDAFSAVDTETEQRIFTNMYTQLRGRTVFLLTHRTPILQKMDRVLYMSEGRIVEDGSPENLLTLKGRFAALAALQTS